MLQTFVTDNTNAPVVAALLAMQNATNGIVGRAGGGQALATPITTTIARVSTCATANDSVVLPTAVAGMWCIIANQGAASMQVYGTGTDTITGVAAATGVAQAAGKSALYFCAAAGNWERVLSA